MRVSLALIALVAALTACTIERAYDAEQLDPAYGARPPVTWREDARAIDPDQSEPNDVIDNESPPEPQPSEPPQQPEPDDDPAPSNGDYQPMQAVYNAFIDGDVGTAHGLADEATLLSVYDDGYYLTLDAVVVDEERAVMMLLMIDSPATVMVPGYEGANTITVLGCIGPEPGMYTDYDAPAGDVEIVVQAGDDDQSVGINVTATWLDQEPPAKATLKATLTR